MTSPRSILEREALDEMERRLSRQGYRVIRQPRGADLPDFLGSFQPDAIAIGRSPSRLLEVITHRGSEKASQVRAAQVRSLLDGHPDWQLDVVYAPSSSPFPSLAPVGSIRQRFEEVRRLSAIDRAAALIVAWSLIEAVARVLVTDRMARGASPGSTVELLASLGHVTQPEADILGKSGRVRDLIAHGDLTVEVPAADLDKVLGILDALIESLEHTAAGVA